MPAQDARFVVVGEALVDIVMAPGAAPAEAPGGSPMNVAVGLARLGVPALLVTDLGDDAHGRLVADHLAGSGVALAGGSLRAGSRTSTATARLDDEGAATYDFDLSWEPAVPGLPEAATGLHVGSLGTVLAPGRDAVVALLDEAVAREVPVSYDPNVRAGLLPTWQEVAAVAARAGVVKMSDEDVAHLRPEEPVQSVARELLAHGRTHLVVVTRGGLGAMAFTEHDNVEVVAPRTDVVDTVGAGDSFMAALDAVLLEWGWPTDLAPERLRTLLEAAARAAAVTVSRRGANPPTRRELPPGWPDP